MSELHALTPPSLSSPEFLHACPAWLDPCQPPRATGWCERKAPGRFWSHRHACQTHLPLHPAFNVGSTRIIDESSSFVRRGLFFAPPARRFRGAKPFRRCLADLLIAPGIHLSTLKAGVQGALFSHSPVYLLASTGGALRQCNLKYAFYVWPPLLRASLYYVGWGPGRVGQSSLFLRSCLPSLLRFRPMSFICEVELRPKKAKKE